MAIAIHIDAGIVSSFTNVFTIFLQMFEYIIITLKLTLSVGV